jgi:signal transduction histidine kinase
MMSLISAEKKNQVKLLLDEAYSIRINDLEKSERLAQRALKLSQELQDMPLTGRSLNQLALFAMIRGSYSHSLRMSKKAIDCFTELDDRRGIADAKFSIAGTYYKTDNYHSGLVYLLDCLSIYKDVRDYHNQSRVYKSLGTIYEYFGDRVNAVKSYRNAVKSAQRAGDSNLESNAYNPLSGIYLKQYKTEQALELVEKAILMKQESGDIRGLAFSLYGRAKVLLHQKDYPQAGADLHEAIRIHLKFGERLGLGMAYAKLGRLHIETGELAQAKNVLYQGIELSSRFNIALIKVKCSYLLYKIFQQENNLSEALRHLEQHLRLKESLMNNQTLSVIKGYRLLHRMETLEKDAQTRKEKAAIIEKKNRAEQAARVKQEFLSTMSHEIRTPLNAVITIASLLSPASEDDRQLLGSLKFASNNLLLIINDILDFTKLEAGKVKLEQHAADLGTLLENLKNTYHSLALEKGLLLSLETDRRLAPSYYLDETKFSQVIGNLVTNAIKFTETGNIAIRILRLEGHEDSDTVRVSVTDTGIGIPRSFMTEIFDSFSQPRSITTRKHGGSGLGLAIVKELIGLFGGTVHVESQEGHGSRFWFDLRLQKAVASVSSQTAHSGLLNGKNVLLAEDNLINAMVAMKLLSRWGIRTEHVKNGLEAIAKSKSDLYDYILMDIHMPEMDGFEATRTIRRNESVNSNTPIFALTADVTADSREEFVPYFDGFLMKPIEIGKLHDALLAASH